VDNISISGDSGANKYDLSMSGIYNWTPPFIYVYEDIKGKLTGNLKTGYFLGFTGCGWNKYGQEVDGIAGFFYIADNNTGGLLIGDVSGSYSTNPNNWNASGSLDWVELSSSGISYPSSVDDITDYARDTSFVSGRGDFYDAGDNDVGDISITMASGIFDSIEETQYWGYLRTKVEGSYSTISGKSMSDFDDWFCQFEQKGLEEPSGTENLRLYMSVDGGTSHYSDGEFEGDVTGGWVDIEHAVTGIAVGELHGGYDPSGASTDFFAASGGVWLETSILMTKLGTEAGRNDLAKLDIPNVQIGKATLSGNGNNMDIALNDVTFLANASDQNPRIWATNNVSGTYSAAPTLGQSIKLTDTTGSHNLAADFTVNTWSGGGNWGGKIDSAAYTTNTLEKTEVAPGTTVNIKFKGAAGGTYTGGNISGTAAGWAK
ncbi:MAG: hypothetical protein KAU60_14605, partial [Desulfobacterales bacterium]|nr:hypothetical protein [Desulfobacterales bacterium]